MAVLSDTLLSVLSTTPNTRSIPQSLITTCTERIKDRRIDLDRLDSPDEESSSTARATQVCSILFGKSTVVPSEPCYEQHMKRNWSPTCHLPAACFLRLSNPLDVALALKVLAHYSVKFAVRSCGHSANPNFASVGQDGIVLDLAEMNKITLSEKGEVVSVGPGATWDAVYEELEKKELTVVGGRAKDVGVGGLITGGGMSHFSNHWGLACDQVKNFEVVLADGRVVDANATENPDLFRALKGGGSNFGIVTRFDLYTYSDHRLWYTFKVYSINDIDRVMQAAVEVQKAMDEDDHIGFFLTVQANYLVAGMLYKGYSQSVPSVFHAFDGIVPITTAVPETNGTQLSAARAAAIDDVAMREIGTVAVRPDAELYVELHRVLEQITRDNNSSSYFLQFTFQPFGAAAATKGLAKGGNILNLRPENQSWLGIIAQWTDDKDADLARRQIRELITGIEETAKKRGKLLDFYFMNDASYWQNPLKSYGRESLQFLEKMSRKWDPDGLLQRLQSGGFLVSKASP